MSRLSRAFRKSRIYRRLFPPRLPQVLVIGAHKCGTSALFKYLAQHPRLLASREKELDFFGSDLRFGLGLEWYAAQWNERAPSDSIRFEASPQYLFEPQAARRIRTNLPNVRLIAILRDPVARAYSAWSMYRRQLADDPRFYDKLYRSRYTAAETARLAPRTAAELEDFGLAVEREAACLERGQRMQCSVLELGLYGPQLRRYLEVFPREQKLILDSSDLRSRRTETLNRVLKFVGLEPWDWSHVDLSEVFVSPAMGKIPGRARDFLREFYLEPNRALQAILDPLPKWADGPT